MTTDTASAFRIASRFARCAAFLATLALVGACDGGDRPEDAPEANGSATNDAPNVVLITVDTLRADALGSYGNPENPTPNLDRLAEEGVLFEQASASAPSTLPSHASILTGKHPFAHGARSNFGYVLPKRNTTLAEVLSAGGWLTAAEIAAPVIGRRTQMDQGFASYRDLASFDVKLNRARRHDDNTIVEFPERGALDITRFGVEFLSENADRPFFLWLHYFDPHRPFAPPPMFRDRFSNRYLDEIAFTDEQIGRVLTALDLLGLAERTIVVATSDHGESLGEHGEETHSYLVYEATMRVPLILRGPGLPSGKRIASVVRTIDIAPTVVDLVGLPPLNDVQGASLLPLISDEGSDGLLAYGESIEAYSAFGSSVLRFLREGRWKYIHKARPELYDITADPDELESLAEQEPAVMARLQDDLRALIEEAPEAPSDAGVELDDEALEQLRALGYVESSAPPIADELASLATYEPDPSDLIADVGTLNRAWGKFGEHDYEVAAALFGEVLDRHPKSLSATRGRARALFRLKRFEDTAAVLDHGLTLDPTDAEFLRLKGQVLDRLGRHSDAERELRAAVAAQPCNAFAYSHLGNHLIQRGRCDEHIEIMRSAIEECGDDANLLNDYAYGLATCRDDTARDGEEAVRIATGITQGDGAANPHYHDTLAAAHAEVGDFAAAEAAAQRAIDLMKSRRDGRQIIAAFTKNLETIQAGEPIREGPEN